MRGCCCCRHGCCCHGLGRWMDACRSCLWHEPSVCAQPWALLTMGSPLVSCAQAVRRCGRQSHATNTLLFTPLLPQRFVFCSLRLSLQAVRPCGRRAHEHHEGRHYYCAPVREDVFMLVGPCYRLEVDKQNLLHHHLMAVWVASSAEPASAHDPACRPRFHRAPACGRPPACSLPDFNFFLQHGGGEPRLRVGVPDARGRLGPSRRIPGARMEAARWVGPAHQR